MIRTIKAALVRKLGYRTYMQGGAWDGQSHYSWTHREAVEWMACYPANVQKYVFDRRGNAIAYQWAFDPKAL